MYRKSAKGWLKHWDFILLDLICLQVAFVMAYMVRHGVSNPYAKQLYVSEAVALILVQIITLIIGENFKSVLRRGYLKEFVATFKQGVALTFASTFYLFMIQEGQGYSRMTLLLTGFFYLGICYPVRILWKKYLLSGMSGLVNKRSLLVLTDSEHASETLHNLESYNYSGFRLCGMAIVDKSMIGETIDGVKVVADQDSIVEYVCREWVDQVLVNVKANENILNIMKACSKMGVTVHKCIYDFDNIIGRQQCIERVGKYTVVTTSVSMVSTTQLFYKRTLDILGGLVGCVLTGILFLFVAPAIYIKSPGPVFFSQVRVGRNGKKFKIYKFRSMYMDAEERKKELMAQNRIEDGMMFKMKDDPRIIKGIGHFIRKYSIDEFPQFLNVLKGDMSLVGTRPPTVDEWEKYDLHHRVRLAIKPGITGMWQVSGRSEITDFEEVVKLDAKYIDEWSFGLDLKILFKTVGSVLGNDGAM